MQFEQQLTGWAGVAGVGVPWLCAAASCAGKATALSAPRASPKKPIFNVFIMVQLLVEMLRGFR
ncbi:hypothetical protein BON30_43215 [Cystobacter ferrugineus]|uniref:Uncharacterized protein n=1 Tax=Cystobacter ferrugineus TaxID=83449 RepID=A0A1L9AX94_9BACT|nr:hypothetical protein BON30_43215 [Cystobacter ferrugineus]